MTNVQPLRNLKRNKVIIYDTKNIEEVPVFTEKKHLNKEITLKLTKRIFSQVIPTTVSYKNSLEIID